MRVSLRPEPPSAVRRKVLRVLRPPELRAQAVDRSIGAQLTASTLKESAEEEPPSQPATNEDFRVVDASLPYGQQILSLPQRILPFADTDTLSVQSSHLHLPSCVGLETRGRKRTFLWRNGAREGDLFLLKLTLDGEGYLEDEERGVTHFLPPGKAFLVPIPSETVYFCHTGKPWTFIWVNMIGPSARRLGNEITRNHGYVFDFRRFPQVLDILAGLYQHRLENQSYDIYHVSAQVYRIFMSILQFHEPISPNLPSSIVEACEYIHLSLGNPNLSVEEIADKMGYSKFYFTRKFRQHMRMAPHQYLTKLRLEKAVDLITTTDLPIKIISDRVGFKEITHFYRIFKKHMKMTPGSLNRPQH